TPGNVPRPPHWGGYRLIPRSFVFWQGRAHRLNDRFLYEKDEKGQWQTCRLAP
ncbi:MAG: pyridoxamine 5'-phosphate oxidase, partial [Planctomycetes bacterium]|nr:pyridoxamine 5'-phosphate oxidase [Planctomycetota bacterium]